MNLDGETQPAAHLCGGMRNITIADHIQSPKPLSAFLPLARNSGTTLQGAYLEFGCSWSHLCDLLRHQDVPVPVDPTPSLRCGSRNRPIIVPWHPLGPVVYSH